MPQDRIGPRCSGKERDAETSLDYFRARYYSGAQGRFTSPDEVFRDQDEGDPQSWNLYSYVRNNPLRYTDPTGGECVDLDGGGKGDNGKGKPCKDPSLNTTHGVTVGVGRDEANLIMLQGIYQNLTSMHQWGTVVSGGAQVAGSVMAPLPTAAAQCATGTNCSQTGLAMALLPGALGASGRAIRILEEAGGVVHLEIQTANGTYEVIANITREGNRIVLEGAHIEGSGAGQFGPAMLREIRAAARQFMQQERVGELVVKPGIRTSGANPGRAMRPFTVRAN